MNKEIDEIYAPLLSFVKKRINNREDAEDITQEVFYKFSKAAFDEKSNFKSLLYRIAKNSIIDYYRKKKIYTEEITDFKFSEDEKSPRITNDICTCIFKFIDKLPKEYQDVIEMSEIQDFSQKDIAENLEMNYTTVRSKIQRGRKKLQNLISDCCDIIQNEKGRIVDHKCSNKNCD
ncbi:sigma-70 family RNA polymerase sigma factor [Aureivirga sp. CE67]|uniref:sigma-70 family RNA polymerase sigma factor n=1 Tax=Aureivirga sp. CE67 TaxID=1788983 RepID=UPI0018CBF04B|nr:sigma-70 family RNA polymerase sigma factor [Aureivirga sp. CE67]